MGKAQLNPSSSWAFYSVPLSNVDLYMLYIESNSLKGVVMGVGVSFNIFPLRYTCIPWESINTQICCALPVSTVPVCAVQSASIMLLNIQLLFDIDCLKPCTFTVFFSLRWLSSVKGLCRRKLILCVFEWVFFKHKLNIPSLWLFLYSKINKKTGEGMRSWPW
jgi:hypothetical protein